MTFSISGQRPRTMLSGIYAIRHVTSGRVYVGKAHCLEARTRQHLNALKSGKHPNLQMQEGYNQDGIAAFSVEIWEIMHDLKRLRSRERFWISAASVRGQTFNSTRDLVEAWKYSFTENVNWEEVQAALRERMGNLKRGEKGALKDKLGISSAVLSQLISGYRPITRERAEEIMKALNGQMNYQPEFPDAPEREA